MSAEVVPASIAVPEETDSSLSTRQKIRKKWIWFCKKLVLFLFSYVGLVCIVICYALLGSVIFRALESWNEKHVTMQIAQERKARLDEIWNITNSFLIFSKDNWTNKANIIMKQFQYDIYKATKDLGWNGHADEAEGDIQWSFVGSLLYSVTVITTIGYGHVTPKTWGGRLVTIIYAVIGIPLTLLCLANIGSFMGKSFRIMYKKIPVINLNNRKRKLSYVKTKPPSRYSNTKKNGDITNFVQNELPNKSEQIQITEYTVEKKQNIPAQVPIVVCFLLVVIYILVGTMLFTLLETEWNALTAAYFCFITLSTIGFGDVVPGLQHESWASQPKQMICTLYLLFGLALLAMCFDLMQDRVREIARKIGMMIRIVEEDKP